MCLTLSPIDHNTVSIEVPDNGSGHSKADCFNLHILDRVTIRIVDFKIQAASYWTNEQLQIFVSTLNRFSRC